MVDRLIHKLASAVSGYLNCVQTNVGCELENERARAALAEYEKWDNPPGLEELLAEFAKEVAAIDKLAERIPGLEKGEPTVNAHDYPVVLVLTWFVPRSWTSKEVVATEYKLYQVSGSSNRIVIRLRRQRDGTDE